MKSLNEATTKQLPGWVSLSQIVKDNFTRITNRSSAIDQLPNEIQAAMQRDRISELYQKLKRMYENPQKATLIFDSVCWEAKNEGDSGTYVIEELEFESRLAKSGGRLHFSADIMNEVYSNPQRWAVRISRRREPEAINNRHTLQEMFHGRTLVEIAAKELMNFGSKKRIK